MITQVNFARTMDPVIETGFLGAPECMVLDCNGPAVERRTLSVIRDGKGPFHITVCLCERCLMKGADQLLRELLPR